MVITDTNIKLVRDTDARSSIVVRNNIAGINTSRKRAEASLSILVCVEILAIDTDLENLVVYTVVVLDIIGSSWTVDTI